MRPATETEAPAFSSAALSSAPYCCASGPAWCAGRKSFGNAGPFARSAFSFSRRS
jgi:hypothetical protein